MEVETIQAENNSFELSSVDEVRKRAMEAEERISSGEFLTQKEYEEEMEKFFKRLDEDN